jgi:cystathionine beta-lyase
MPFLIVPGLVGREIIQVQMHDDDGFFTLDLDGIDAAFRAGGYLLIFCSPYNPLGRVFSLDEMTRLTEVVERHGGRVFADEVHGPLCTPVPASRTRPRLTRQRRTCSRPPRHRRRGTCPASCAPR